MLHVWSERTDGAPGAWTAAPLDGAAHHAPDGRWCATSSHSSTALESRPRLLPVAGARTWVVIGPAHVRVNAAPLDVGIHVVRDRDEIVVEGARYFLTTVAAPTVEPFAGEAPVDCARCRRPIAPGDPSVRCPACGVVHHQRADDLLCWTYAAHCVGCDQPTALDGSVGWTPEVL